MLLLPSKREWKSVFSEEWVRVNLHVNPEEGQKDEKVKETRTQTLRLRGSLVLWASGPGEARLPEAAGAGAWAAVLSEFPAPRNCWTLDICFLHSASSSLHIGTMPLYLVTYANVRGKKYGQDFSAWRNIREAHHCNLFLKCVQSNDIDRNHGVV